MNSIEKLIAKALPYLKGQAAQLRAHGFTGSKVHSEIEEIIRELEQTLARESAAPEPHLATRVLNGMEVETGEPMSAASAAPAYWTKERLRSELSDILVFGKSDAQIIAELELLIERRDREVARSSERDVPAEEVNMTRDPRDKQESGEHRADSESTSAPFVHTRSCPALNPMSDDACTCGLKWRIRLRTEMEMHNAWRKRAEEAEASQDAVRREALEEAAAVIERSPTWNKHKEGPLCWCELCAYVRGNASEIRALGASPAGRAAGAKDG